MGRFNSRSTTVAMAGLNGNGMTIGPGPGDFTFSETDKENTEKVRVMDRGSYECDIETDDREQTWSITLGLKNQSLTDTLTKRVPDFFDQTGIFDPSTGTSPTVTVNANSTIWSWITTVTMVLGSGTATWVLPICKGTYAFTNAPEGATLALSGTNNGKPAKT